MPGDEGEPTGPTTTRRRVLAYGGLAALAGLLGLGAARRLGGADPAGRSTPTATPEPTPDRVSPTSTPDPDWLPTVRRYAPDLHFGRRERWFPTDPREYADDGIVDGPTALASYHRDFRTLDAPPHPTVFYNVVPLSEAVVALQYWFYSVFDQFAVNFHWHDWELLQVFVDRETETPILLSASAHARNCPNNEYRDPDLGDGGRPVVLAEVGSHSSATDVNANRPRFERVGVGELPADVTNAFVRPVDGLVEQPFAYGLPRDEGLGVPYSLPELDGFPLPDHPALGDVGPGDFVPPDVTVRDWRDLARPPSSLPGREAGLVFTEQGSGAAGDHTYALHPLDDAARAIADLTGPRLSFEFAIPSFVEERESVASHITTAGIPWEDERSSDPASDITDPAHRRAVTGAAPAGLENRVVGVASILLGRSDGLLPGIDEDDAEALAPLAAVSGFPLPTAVAVLLRSDPVATVSSGGVFRFLHVEPGTHELIVNGPGLAPYAERFDHRGGTVRPGVDGRLSLVPNEDAVVLRADRRDSTGVTRVRVVETHAGPVFDAAPVEDGRFAVPVHRAGEYTVEVVDDDGASGIVRVDGEALDGEPLPPIETGKATVARELATHLEESATLARELRNRQEESATAVPEEFLAAADDARSAAEFAGADDAAVANDLLREVIVRIGEIVDRLGGVETGYTPIDAARLRHRARRAEDLAKAAFSSSLAG